MENSDISRIGAITSNKTTQGQTVDSLGKQEDRAETHSEEHQELSIQLNKKTMTTSPQPKTNTKNKTLGLRETTKEKGE